MVLLVVSPEASSVKLTQWSDHLINTFTEEPWEAGRTTHKRAQKGVG